MVFFLDAVSALFDLIVFIASPKIANKRQRLKETRLADISGQQDRKASEKFEETAPKENRKNRQVSAPIVFTGPKSFTTQNLNKT